MIFANLRIQPEDNHRLEALELLHSIQGPVQAIPGCTSCRVSEESSGDHAILLGERWESDEDFREHVRSDLFDRILAALELSRVPPEVCIHQVSGSEGLELIYRLRGIEIEKGVDSCLGMETAQ